MLCEHALHVSVGAILRVRESVRAHVECEIVT